MSNAPESRGAPALQRINSALHAAGASAGPDVHALLEDLRIHQVELEMQAQALRASEARAQAERLRLQHLLTEVPVALVRIDGMGRILSLNRAAEQLLGLSSVQAEGKHLHRLGTTESERMRLLHAVNLGLRAPRHVSRAHQCKLHAEAGTVDLHMSQVPGVAEDGQPEWLVSLVDQSEAARRQAQQDQTLEELRQALARNRDLASVADAMPDMVAICDHDESVLWLNPAMHRVLGWSRVDLVGRNVLDVLIGGAVADGGNLVREVRMQWQLHDTVQRQRLPLQGEAGPPVLADVTMLTLRDATSQVVRRIVIARDVSDTVRLEAERELVMRQQALHTVQSEFLSRMSHNMRTPLNAIMGFSQLLAISLGNRLGSEDQQRLRIMHEAGEQLLHMVDQALSLVQGDQLARQMELSAVHLAPLVSDVATLLAEKSAAKRIKVSIDVPEDAQVIGHGQLVHEVVVNLLSNAIKYSHPGQTVQVRVERVGVGELALQVVDRGIGIDEADVPRLFQPFHRLEAGRSMASGHGLGLAISAQQVRWMDGRLEVSSRPGMGSVFSLVLPTPHPSTLTDSGPLQPDVRRLLESLPPMVVLYVEDDEVNIAVMMATVANCPQVRMFTAETLAQGRNLLHVVKPDVVLLDINLPDGNGLELCRESLAQGLADAPVFLALSADVTPGQVEQARAAGVLRFLAKPLNLALLGQALHEVALPRTALAPIDCDLNLR